MVFDLRFFFITWVEFNFLSFRHLIQCALNDGTEFKIKFLEF